MAREDDISRFAGQRRAGEVPDRASKNGRRLAPDDHCREPDPRDLNLANRIAIDPCARRCHVSSRMLESSVFDRLIGLCVDDDVRGEREREETGCEQCR